MDDVGQDEEEALQKMMKSVPKDEEMLPDWKRASNKSFKKKEAADDIEITF